MINCTPSPSRINISVSRETNPNLDISGLEALGFVGCLKNPATQEVIEWVKSTDTDNDTLVPEMERCGVTVYIISDPEPKIKFMGLHNQIKTGYIDAITSRPCPPIESKPIFNDYDLNSEPRIKDAPGGKITGTIAVSENDLPEIK